jgi:hypothetical protein
MRIIAWIGALRGSSLTTKLFHVVTPHRGYHSGTPVLVRAEKRLYQDPGRPPPADERRVYQWEPPL